MPARSRERRGQRAPRRQRSRGRSRSGDRGSRKSSVVRRGPRASATFVAVALLAVLFAGAPGARATSPVSHRHELTNATIANWAPVLRRVAAHRRPDASSRVVAKVATITSDWTQNIVLVLDAIERNPGEAWFQIRLSILPNNSTGW